MVRSSTKCMPGMKGKPRDSTARTKLSLPLPESDNDSLEDDTEFLMTIPCLGPMPLTFADAIERLGVSDQYIQEIDALCATDVEGGESSAEEAEKAPKERFCADLSPPATTISWDRTATKQEESLLGELFSIKEEEHDTTMLPKDDNKHTKKMQRWMADRADAKLQRKKNIKAREAKESPCRLMQPQTCRRGRNFKRRPGTRSFPTPSACLLDDQTRYTPESPLARFQNANKTFWPPNKEIKKEVKEIEQIKEVKEINESKESKESQEIKEEI